MSTPVLHLLAGPNGAGKSTRVTRVLQPTTHLLLINADLIAADRWPENEAEHAYDAAHVAEAARQRLMRAGESFITETVFSHPSKVDLTAQASRLRYLVHLHVVMVPVDVALGRVEHRGPGNVLRQRERPARVPYRRQIRARRSDRRPAMAVLDPACAAALTPARASVRPCPALLPSRTGWVHRPSGGLTTC